MTTQCPETAPLPLPKNKDGSIWVFGYGSLIWNPGFEYLNACKAEVVGLHRSFCVWSTTYRGTEASPGLVMGLDQGGSCLGKAYEVNPNFLQDSMAYLYEREMDTFSYIPSVCSIRLFEDETDNQTHNQSSSSRTVEALTFVVDQKSPAYACNLNPTKKAEIINRSFGSRGPNIDYIINTYEHLNTMGIEDTYLRSIVEKL